MAAGGGGSSSQLLDPLPAAEIEDPEIKRALARLRQVFKPYKGDRFGNHDQSAGIVYMSRLDPSADPRRPSRATVSVSEKMMESVFESDDELASASVNASNMHEKQRRFAISLATLSAKPWKRQKIVQCGAVPMLNFLSTVDDKTVRRATVLAYRYLSVDAQLRRQLIDQDAVHSVVMLCLSGGRKMKMDCLATLCNLAAEPGYEQRIVKEGAVAAAMAAVVMSSKFRELGLTMLLNLSCVPEKYNKMEDVSDAVLHAAPLVTNVTQEALILRALCNFSALKHYQSRLIDDGCLRVVESYYSHSKAEIRALCASILFNLSCDSRTRPKMADIALAPVLNQLGKDAADEVKLTMMKCVYNLTHDPRSREKLVHVGILKDAISGLAAEPDCAPEEGCVVAKTLRILCTDRHLTPKLIDDGIVVAILGLLEHSDSRVREYCAEAICALFEHEAVLEKLREQGAIEALIRICMATNDASVAEWCAFAIYHIITSSHAANTLKLFGPNLLEVLLYLPSKHEDDRVSQYVAAAIMELTIAQLDGVEATIPVLVAMLKSSTDTVRSYCASALYNFAGAEKNCEAMLTAGALVPVVQLIQSPHLPTKIKCAAILSRLTAQQAHIHEFARPDVIDVLLGMAKVDHMVTCRRILIALSNLSIDPEIRALMKGSVIDTVVKLATKSDEYIRRGCAAVICNLTYESSVATQPQSQVTSTLLITALVASDNILTRKICLRALINLLVHDELHAAAIDDGIVWGLATLSKADDAEMKVLSLQGLCNLSKRFGRQVLASAVAVREIHSATQSEDIQLKELGAKTLLNVALVSTEADASFRNESVLVLPHLIASTPDLQELGCLIGNLISQSAECSQAIMQSGVIAQLSTSTLHQRSQVQLAFVGLLHNITRDPVTRARVMDKQLVEKLHLVAQQSEDQLTRKLVICSLYQLSCAMENLADLTKQNALLVIKGCISGLASFREFDAVLHLAALLHNMTMDESNHPALVNQGMVTVLGELWSKAATGTEAQRLIACAAGQLACGKINSTRFVADGGGRVVCDIALNYKDDPLLCRMCAASLRNLLYITSNQERLVKDGAIEAIVALSSLSGEELVEDCACSLRSLSYNTLMRDLLLQTDAIQIILNDMRSGTGMNTVMVDNSLLCEIEAESWSNGSRGFLREGKALYKPRLTFHEALLSQEPSPPLKAKPMSVPLEKALCEYSLPEPEIDMEQENEKLLDTVETLVQADVYVAELTAFAKVEILPPEDLARQNTSRSEADESEDEHVLTAREPDAADDHGDEQGATAAGGSGGGVEKPSVIVTDDHHHELFMPGPLSLPNDSRSRLQHIRERTRSAAAPATASSTLSGQLSLPGSRNSRRHRRPKLGKLKKFHTSALIKEQSHQARRSPAVSPSNRLTGLVNMIKQGQKVEQVLSVWSDYQKHV